MHGLFCERKNSAGALFLVLSATPRRAPARIALHAGAVAHQGEVAAFAAGFAFVALGLGFRALFGDMRAGVLFQRLRRREFLRGFGFQRGGAGGVESGDV